MTCARITGAPATEVACVAVSNWISAEPDRGGRELDDIKPLTGEPNNAGHLARSRAFVSHDCPSAIHWKYVIYVFNQVTCFFKFYKCILHLRYPDHHQHGSPCRELNHVGSSNYAQVSFHQATQSSHRFNVRNSNHNISGACSGTCSLKH